jgi:hypothetical protein
MRGLAIGIAASLLLVGCAALKQAKADVETGKRVLAEQGTSGTAEATKLIEPFLPFVPDPIKPFVMPLAGILGLAVAWNVGRKDRKGQLQAAPFLGFGGKLVGAEFVLQQVVTVLVGIFRIVEVIANKGKTAVATVLPVKEQPPA